MPRTFPSIAYTTLAVLLLSSILVATAEARTVVRTGETVSLAADQTVEGDFYATAGTVSISGTVTEDVVVAAGQLNVNGSIGDNAFLIGGGVDVNGVTGDDLRIVAGEVTIAEPVLGDLFIMGGSINLLSTASVTGDVLLYGGEATIAGAVGGDILGTIGTLRIDAAVAGDIDVTVERLTLGDRAAITGAVRYVSTELAVRAPNAVVEGDLLRSDPILPRTEGGLYSTLIPILVLLFSVLGWHLVSRRTLGLVATHALTLSPRPLLFGFIALVVVPFAVGVLMVSVLGTILSLVLLSAYMLLLMLSVVSVPAVLGQLLMRVFNQPTAQLSLLSIVVGIVGVTVLLVLPILGGAVLLLLMILALGAMIDLLLRPTTMGE